MKTITKTFYVSDSYIKMIEKNEDTYLSPVMTGSNRIEIKISWQEPEKKIEITEGEFDELWEKMTESTCVVLNYKQFLKNELFGNSEG